MKKIIALLLCLCMACSLVACTQDNPADKTPDKDRDQQGTVPGADLSGENLLVDGPMTVYRNNDITITYTKLEKAEHAGRSAYILHYEINNQSDMRVMYQTDHIAFNGVTMPKALSVSAEAHGTWVDQEYFYCDDLEALGITKVQNIKCYGAALYDITDYTNEVYLDAVEFILNCGDVDFYEAPNLDGETIYENRGISVVYKGTQDTADGGMHAAFTVYNNTEDHIWVNTDKFEGSGMENLISDYDAVYSGMTADIVFTWSADDLANLGDAFGSLSFTMSILNLTSFDAIERDLHVSVELI